MGGGLLIPFRMIGLGMPSPPTSVRVADEHPVAGHSINPVAFYEAYRRSELRSGKSEPDVVGNPYAGLIHELGLQNGPHVLKIFAAILARQARKKAKPKSFKKTRNVSRQGSWACGIKARLSTRKPARSWRVA